MSLHHRGDEEEEKMKELLQVLFFLCPSRVPLEGSVPPFPCGRVVPFAALSFFCPKSLPWNPWSEDSWKLFSSWLFPSLMLS